LRRERHALQDQRMTSTLDHVDELLQSPNVHPSGKYCATHWRLVELADLDCDFPQLASRRTRSVDWRPRRHASMEGGFRRLVDPTSSDNGTFRVT
jgi:hypothetical protein